jgi:hypothetical protein
MVLCVCLCVCAGGVLECACVCVYVWRLSLSISVCVCDCATDVFSYPIPKHLTLSSFGIPTPWQHKAFSHPDTVGPEALESRAREGRCVVCGEIRRCMREGEGCVGV